MRVPITDKVEPSRKTITNLSMLQPPVWAKFRSAATIQPFGRSCFHYNCARFIEAAEKLTASFFLERTGLTVSVHCCDSLLGNDYRGTTRHEHVP